MLCSLGLQDAVDAGVERQAEAPNPSSGSQAKACFLTLARGNTKGKATLARLIHNIDAMFAHAPAYPLVVFHEVRDGAVFQFLCIFNKKKSIIFVIRAAPMERRVESLIVLDSKGRVVYLRRKAPPNHSFLCASSSVTNGSSLALVRMSLVEALVAGNAYIPNCVYPMGLPRWPTLIGTDIETRETIFQFYNFWHQK